MWAEFKKMTHDWQDDWPDLVGAGFILIFALGFLGLWLYMFFFMIG